MSRTQRVEGCVLASDGWIRGALQFGDRVQRFFGERASAPTPFDDVVLPGFVDLHVHGGGGADVMEGGDAIERIARMHARHGTTAFLATTVTADARALSAALEPV